MTYKINLIISFWYIINDKQPLKVKLMEQIILLLYVITMRDCQIYMLLKNLFFSMKKNK